MAKENKTRVDCKCGSYLQMTGPMASDAHVTVRDFWKQHRFCKEGDEPLESFMRKIEDMFEEKGMWSKRYEYVERRLRGLIDV